MAVAYRLLIVVQELPPGAVEARRNPGLGDARCNMYTTQDVFERLAAPDAEVFRLSVHSMIARRGLSSESLVHLQAIMPQFANMHTLNLEGIHEPMSIRLGHGINCTVFKMEGTTAACRVLLGQRVTHAILDEMVVIVDELNDAEMVLPHQLIRLDFTMHGNVTVPQNTSLQSVTARSLVPRVLTVPQHTPQAIHYRVAPQVTLSFAGGQPLTMVTIGGDDTESEDEAPRVRRMRIDPPLVRRLSRMMGGDDGTDDVRVLVAYAAPPMLTPIQVAAVEGTVCSACLDGIAVGVNCFKAYPCAHPICEGCNARRGEVSMRRCPLCASSHFCTPLR